ncbi:MAG TPA: PLP-dependent aminotransferase family protein [Acidimicrobiales bacterium]|nr:PLP-dependent aminotransferase family protein [Acidimicrobiales bacterium]
MGGGRLHRLLASRLSDLAERGQLTAGVRLPPERALAEVLGISRTTVVAAYRTLKADGRVAARQGSGTYVLPPDGPSRGDDPVIGALARNQLFAALGDAPRGTIDLATAIPPAAACVVRALPESHDVRALCSTTGYFPAGSEQLRGAIADAYRAQGLVTTAEQILVTSGAQQAISLVASLYLRPGDAVVVDQPTFPGALDVFRAAGARLLSMPVDTGGARVDVLERLVRRTAPHLVYLVATHHNPTGSVLTPARRERLAAVAANGQIPVVDDTTLADLDHDGGGELPAPVATFAPAAPVITIGSMSKLFWGGLRVGWVRAAEPVITRLRRLKTIADLGSPFLEQAWATRLLEHVPEVRAERRAELGHRRGVLESSLAELLPSWRWTAPRGGLSLWVQVPGDTRALAASALRNGVSVVPGPQFCADEGCADHLRVPFTQEPEVLVEGVRRLARAWDDHQPGLVSGADSVVV